MIQLFADDQTDELTSSRVHGWCQAGMSAHYADEETILLGAAGSYNWRGR